LIFITVLAIVIPNETQFHQHNITAPVPKLTTTVPTTHHASRSGMDRLAALPMAMPAIAVPVAGIPLLPLMAIPDAIDITEPSAIVIKASFVAELDILVEVCTARAATGSLFHSIVIAGREGVAIGFIFGAEVMLDFCARTAGMDAAKAMLKSTEYCILLVVRNEGLSASDRLR
jgi:hypothetical protein